MDKDTKESMSENEYVEKTNKGGKMDTRQRYLFPSSVFRDSVSVHTDRDDQRF